MTESPSSTANDALPRGSRQPSALQQTLGWIQAFFEFLGMLVTIAGLVLVVTGIEDKKPMFILLCVLGGICFLAGRGIQQRNRSGYFSALCGTVVLLAGFPLLTLPGIFILLKLIRREVRTEFGWHTGGNTSAHEQDGEG